MARQKTYKAEYIRTMVRLPEEIFTYVRQQAAVHDRSINTQFIHLLRRGMALGPPHDPERGLFVNW